MSRIVWTDAQILALREERGKGEPVLICAEKVGVCYPVTLRKCQELNLAGRLNRGRRPGTSIAADQRRVAE